MIGMASDYTLPLCTIVSSGCYPTWAIASERRTLTSICLKLCYRQHLLPLRICEHSCSTRLGLDRQSQGDPKDTMIGRHSQSLYQVCCGLTAMCHHHCSWQGFSRSSVGSIVSGPQVSMIDDWSPTDSEHLFLSPETHSPSSLSTPVFAHQRRHIRQAVDSTSARR